MPKAVVTTATASPSPRKPFLNSHWAQTAADGWAPYTGKARLLVHSPPTM